MSRLVSVAGSLQGFDVIAHRARLRLAVVEMAVHRANRGIVGLRIVDRIGWTRLLRLAFAGYWAVSLVVVAIAFRPDLIHPADIGSDSSNYIAAAERTAAHHPIYELRPGDRPVPLDNPPDWNVPILSPPSAATLYLGAAVLPDGVRLYPAWAIGLAGTVMVGLLVAAMAPPLLLVLLVQFLPGLAVTAWSGNLNSLIAPAIVVAFLGVRSESKTLQTIAGVVVAAIACAKIGPLILGIWVLSQRRRPATVALVGSGLLIATLTVALAGVSSLTEYLEVVRRAAAEPSSLSVPGLVRAAGFSDGASNVAFLLSIVASAILTVLLRDRPAGLLVAVLGTIFATSVVRYESIGVIVATGVGWMGRGLLLDHLPVSPDGRRQPKERGVEGHSKRRLITVTVAVGLAVATASTGISMATGGLERSSVSISNDGEDAVVVRFSVPSQSASFGFLVPPHSTIAAWQALSGGSPPFATFWTPTCDFLGRSTLPRSGGGIHADGPQVWVGQSQAAETESGTYAPTCAAELISRYRNP